MRHPHSSACRPRCAGRAVVCFAVLYVNTGAVCVKLRAVTSPGVSSNEVRCPAHKDSVDEVSLIPVTGMNEFSIVCPSNLQDSTGFAERTSVFIPVNTRKYCITDTVLKCAETGAEEPFTSVFANFKTAWWTLDKNEEHSRTLSVPLASFPVFEETITLGCRTTWRGKTDQRTTTYNCSVRIHVLPRKQHNTGLAPPGTDLMNVPLCVLCALLASVWGATAA